MRALANEQRLMILCNLLDGPLSVGELNEKVDLSQSALLPGAKIGSLLEVFFARHRASSVRFVEHITCRPSRVVLR